VGIGFAIPADLADNITKQLISGGKITRGYIGATIQNFTSEMAEAQGMAGQKGAIVADLVPGGPSAKAGLNQGDVVVSVNGVGVRTSAELTREVAKAHAGDTLKLAVLRDGKKREVDIKSGVRPSEQQLASNDNRGGANGEPNSPTTPHSPVVLGLALSPLDDGSRKRIGADAAVRGVVVTAVERSSDAAQRGIQKDDIVTHAGDREVASASDVAAAVDAAKKAGRQAVLLGIYRGGRTIFLPLKVSG
jgi:serine protease Do